MADPQENTIEATDEILEGASEVAEGVVQMARGFSGLALSGAFVVGVSVGGALGYFLCKRRLETKYNDLAQDEIAEMREHYYRKSKAAEEKGNLEDIVRERGYATEPETEPPMAVTPPTTVVEAAREEEPKPTPEPEVRNAFQDYGDDVVKSQDEDEWDWHKERSKRSPLRPYVVHVDEVQADGYETVTFTYFEEDDVLCNERDEVLDEEERERIVGEKNLEKFGHGSGDPTIVWVRNDQLEMNMEICRSPNSYAEEVHGFEPEIRHAHQRRERMTFDDE